MGNYLTKWWWGGDPDVQDPFSGLTKRDIYSVQKSWAILYAKQVPKYSKGVLTLTEPVNYHLLTEDRSEIATLEVAVLRPEEMGSWLTHIWWGGNPDIPHPYSGLSKRDIHAVRKSWALVYANPMANGTELLKRLYRAFPETKEFFRMIRNLSEDEYEHNHQFRAHVMNLMISINTAVTHLDQPETVAAMMNKLGESHGRRKIQQRHFADLKGVIVNMFIEVLHLDNATLGSWDKTVDFLYRHIFATLEPEQKS